MAEKNGRLETYDELDKRRGKRRKFPHKRDHRGGKRPIPKMIIIKG